ncbi:hypothetical protein K1719_017625 [Acacia pycnantha]|nr:hypothetical protein K1719_017625 [Acacia pycnantha]
MNVGRHVSGNSHADVVAYGSVPHSVGARLPKRIHWKHKENSYYVCSKIDQSKVTSHGVKHQVTTAPAESSQVIDQPRIWNQNPTVHRDVWVTENSPYRFLFLAFYSESASLRERERERFDSPESTRGQTEVTGHRFHNGDWHGEPMMGPPTTASIRPWKRSPLLRFCSKPSFRFVCTEIFKKQRRTQNAENGIVVQFEICRSGSLIFLLIQSVLHFDRASGELRCSDCSSLCCLICFFQ